MISYIRGELCDIEEQKAIVDVNGVGYGIYMPQQALSLLPPMGQQVKIHTYLNIREDAMQLFGFLTKEDLNVFRLLIGVNGIGPKAGLNILSCLSPDELRFAVLSGDAKAISATPGIGKKTAEKLRKEYNAEIITVVANVADRAQMDAAAAQGVEKFGEINVACCNAGVCRLAPFEEMDDKTRDFHIDVNIKGVWNTCKAVIPYMLKQGGGNIVIASSVTGDIVADAGEAAYAMTKAALVGLTKCLAVEYASRNIRVNCSQLGYARTPMVEKMAVESNPENPEAAIADIAVGVPMKRLAKPIEVGELFAFLGSDESSYLTGSQIVIDGGSTLPETMSIGTN